MHLFSIIKIICGTSELKWNKFTNEFELKFGMFSLKFVLKTFALKFCLTSKCLLRLHQQ